MLDFLHTPRQSPGQCEKYLCTTGCIHGFTIVVNSHQSYKHIVSLLLVLLTRIELVSHPYQGCVLSFNYRSMLIGLAGGNRTPICSLGVSGIVHYTTARLAGPERIELPPPGSKPGMISISPKADVKNPAVISTRAQCRAVLLAEAVRFELTEPFDPAVFKTAVIDLSTTLPRLVENIFEVSPMKQITAHLSHCYRVLLPALRIRYLP